MSPRIPREHGAAGHSQFVNDMLHTPGMLMPAMQEYDRASLIGTIADSRPMPVEQRRAIRRMERSFFADTHICDTHICPHNESASARPPRTRLQIVNAIRIEMAAGISVNAWRGIV